MLARHRLLVVITLTTALFLGLTALADAKRRDRNPPETTITSGPLGTITVNSASYSFTSSETRSTFQCKLDLGSWGACASPKAYSNLSIGLHTFSVRAIDRAGNVDPTPASRSITVDLADLVPPETTIDSGPSGTITTSSAAFAFSSSEPGSTFECKLDADGWVGCASPKGYSALADGVHNFSVRAIDNAGNADPTPAGSGFVVDTAAPSPSGPPSGTIVQADYMNRACPIDGLWGAASDAYFYEQSCSGWSDAGDPQVDYFATGGYPLASPDGQVHPGFRRLRLTDGLQSIYDAGVGNSSYRTQLVSNSDTATFYPMQPGHRYVWWVSVRFQDPTPLAGDGVSNDSQIWQIKNTGTCASSSEVGPVESLAETRSTLILKNRQRDGDLRVDTFPIGQRGVWQMFALDVLYSNDPTKAAYRLWADQNGDSRLDLVPLTPKLTGRVTAVGPDCIGKPSIGPYQPLDIPAVSRDYGVNEMVEVPVGAPWD